MRFRLAILMNRAGLHSAYGLAKATRGAMPITTASRLIKAGTNLKRIDIATLDVLCDALDAEPGEFFERDKPKRRNA